MKIATRVLIGFLAMSFLLALISGYAVNRMADVSVTTETIVQRDFAMISRIGEIRQNHFQGQIAADDALKAFYLRQTDRRPGSFSEFESAYRAAASRTAASLADALSSAQEYQRTAVSEDRRAAWAKTAALIGQAASNYEQTRAAVDEQFRAMGSGNLDAVAEAQADISAQRDSFRALLGSVEDLVNEVIDIGQSTVRTTYDDSRLSLIAASAVAVALSLVLAYVIRRSIVGPLGSFMSFVDRVGRGDLAGQTAATGSDELGSLGQTLNTMVEGLRSIARQMRDATENMNAATAEIRASTQEQAAGVEEQLAAVQETAATVDEITHAGAQIGKRAQEVIASAQATAQTSTQGLKAVDETSRAMDAIRQQAEAVAENILSLSEKTQAIGEIISTVNDISERSHLLSLNAAIEAAAAGENGRSFAVVAAEMKLLADQAKEATTQVRGILGDIQRGINASVMLTEESVKRVTAGKERTDTTQKTITEITARIQESVQTFQQIVASTNQQQLGIEQVMGALQNIRQASQQTAAGTRQLDTAAGNLTTLSQQLLGLAERYRI